MGSLGEGTSSELWASMSVILGRDFTGSMRHISWMSISLDRFNHRTRKYREVLRWEKEQKSGIILGESWR